MALPIFQRNVVDAQGNILPGAQVTVRDEATGNLVTLFSDREGNTALSNPFFADAQGLALFYSNPGEYRIDAIGAGGTVTWRYVQVIDTQDITTIGDNFADIETAADNIQAIIDAPQAATNAANSATSAANSATAASNSADDAATSAASVNAANIVHAPNTGLPNEAGTAYASDVTTNATDTTSGRLLKVGDFGVGRNQGITLQDLDDKTVRSGLYSAIGSTLNNTLGTTLTVLVQNWGAVGGINYVTQTAIRSNNGRMFFRSVNSSNNWLPWREIYHTGNILGTVSATGTYPNLVPTGAIMESGSNANGEYVKYADGTMICFHSTSLIFTNNGSFVSRNWSYPSVFTVAPRIILNPSIDTVPSGFSNISSTTVGAVGGRFPTNSSAVLYIFASSNTTGRGVFADALAIGRWK